MDALAQVRGHAAAEAADLQRIRKLTDSERAHQFELACASASEILESRRQMGMPPASAVTWPNSTLEFLRRAAAACREHADE